jgi:hypothetical protein
MQHFIKILWQGQIGTHPALACHMRQIEMQPDKALGGWRCVRRKSTASSEPMAHRH